MRSQELGERKKHPSVLRVLFGLIVLGQVVFLLTSNFCAQFTTTPPTAIKFWEDATGQEQVWQLFAPTMDRECVFPAVEFVWDGEATELRLSKNEPGDLNRYFRFGDARLRRFENCIVLALRPEEGESTAETERRFRDKIQKHVRDYATNLEGYLRWQTRQMLHEQPERKQPQQVTLILRRYHINAPEQAPPFWSGPFSMPLCRLKADSALEWYDPVAGCFRSLQP